MQSGLLAIELQRIADEARSARERLRDLIRLAVELRERLDKEVAEGPAPARKLEAV